MDPATADTLQTGIAPLEDGAWLDWADPDHILAAHPQWAAAAEGEAAAVAAFRRYGLQAGAELAAGLDFDPDYYAEANPETEGLAAAERYRYFLTEGLALGHAGSPAAHLRLLGLELAAFPAAFPWQYYARLRPRAGAHRWAALADFLATGFAECGEEIVLGGAAGMFLCALGRHYSGVRDALAIRAYERARSAGMLPAAEQQHLADAYLRQGCWRPALDLYRALVAAQAATAWTLRNAIKCARQLGISEALAEDMQAAAPSLAPDEFWPETVAEALRAWFEHGEHGARALLAAGDEGAAEQALAALTATLAARIETLLPAPPEVSTAPGYTLFLVNLDDPDRARRRVHAKLAMLDRLGQPHRLIPFGDMAAFLAALPGAGAVVAFQVPALPEIVLGLVQARRQGCRLYYDSDHDLSGAGPLPPVTAYRGFLSRGDYEDLQYGHALYRAAARLCDDGLAPTRGLAAGLAALCRSGRSFVVGDAAEAAAAQAMPPPLVAGGVAGSVCLRLSVRQFQYVDTEPGSYGEILRDLLAAHPHVTLSLAGPVKLAPAFSELGRQIRRDDGETGTASRADPVIALVIALMIPAAVAPDSSPASSPGQDYQALCVWQEAAGQGIAAVLPLAPDNEIPAGDALALLRDDDTMLGAATAPAWREAVLGLLGDPQRALRIGAAAQAALQARAAAGAEDKALAGALNLAVAA